MLVLSTFFHPLGAQIPANLCSEFGSGKIINIGAPNTTVNASTLSSTYFAPGAKIYIQGTLNIDVNTTFDGCLVRMGTNATINIAAFVVVIIQNSSFFSCDNMWAGININVNSNIVVSGSQFEDALVCFSVNVYSAQSFSDNFFNRNRVGIRISVPQNFYPFEGNTFTCSSTLKAPWAGTFSRCGIEVLSTSATLGTPNQEANIFSGMQCGIYAWQSVIHLQRANFINMSGGSDNFGGQPGGSGIISIGGTLYLNESFTAFNENTACHFEDNDKAGIVTRGTIQHIKNALFSNNQFGIDSRANSNAQPFHVYFSEFRELGRSPLSSPSINGIYHERSNANQDQQYDEISSNRFITATQAAATLIFGVQVIGASATSNCSINRNQFENFANRAVKCVSVSVNQADHFYVDDNHMTFHTVSSFTDRFGIELLSGTGMQHTAKRDTITGDNGDTTAHTFRCAFHVNGVPNFKMCRNITDWGFRGFHFISSCNPTDFRENNIGHHEYGLHLLNNAAIGVQTRTLNCWSTDAGAYLIQAALNTNPGWQNSRFIVHSQDPKFYPPLRSPVDWFIPQSGTENSCNELFGENSLDSFDIQVAAGSYQISRPVDVWDAERRVYFKLLRFPDLSAEPEVSDFFDQINNSSSGQFARVDFELWKAVLTTEATQEDLDGIRAAMSIKIDSLQLLDSVLAAAFDSATLAQRGLLMQSIALLTAQEQDTREQASADRVTALDSVALMVENLPQSSGCEQARADYLTLIIKKWQELAFTSTDLDMIRTLAQEQDTLIGLTALDARSLLPAGDSLWAELIDPYCAAQPEDRQFIDSGAPRRQLFLMSVSPNPANRRVIIRFSSPVSGQFLVFDALGKTQKESRLDRKGHVFVETAHWRPGVYTCLLRSQNGSTYQGKLVISH